MEIDKYYTPVIDEFHIGFECESNYILINRGNYPESSNFIPFTLTDENIGWMLDAYIHDAYPTEFRVKYLDIDDIKDLGFELTESNEYDWKFRSKNGELDLEYMVWFTGGAVAPKEIDPNECSEHRLIKLFKHYGREERTLVFRGMVKNKSELKKLLSQLEYFSIDHVIEDVSNPR